MEKQELLGAAEFCISEAISCGADDAEVLAYHSIETMARQRLGNTETVERAETAALGLRVLIGDKAGYRQSMVSSNAIDKPTLKQAVARCIAMAKEAPADNAIGLADASSYVKTPKDLDIADSRQVTDQELITLAEEAESAALVIDGITNSDGAEASQDATSRALVSSRGLEQYYTSTAYGLSVSVIAGEGKAMETDYDYTMARYWDDLMPASEVGKSAAERALKRLNPVAKGTASLPVVMDPRVARSLLKSFAQAINGNAIVRGTSFLQDAMDSEIFSPSVTIIDDPHRLRGISSEPFDDEGVEGKALTLVDRGRLTGWLLDIRSANKLGLTTNGRASRGLSSVSSPSSTNLYMQAGEIGPEELYGDMKEGFYVTEAFGMGINPVTGDYSQGASGFWIEQGKLTVPVTEMTIAGNLKDMFKGLTPANDLEFRYGTNAPTVRIEKMTVAGS